MHEPVSGAEGGGMGVLVRVESQTQAHWGHSSAAWLDARRNRAKLCGFAEIPANTGLAWLGVGAQRLRRVAIFMQSLRNGCTFCMACRREMPRPASARAIAKAHGAALAKVPCPFCHGTLASPVPCRTRRKRVPAMRDQSASTHPSARMWVISNWRLRWLAPCARTATVTRTGCWSLSNILTAGWLRAM